jgi:hypothetical protein
LRRQAIAIAAVAFDGFATSSRMPATKIEETVLICGIKRTLSMVCKCDVLKECSVEQCRDSVRVSLKRDWRVGAYFGRYNKQAEKYNNIPVT